MFKSLITFGMGFYLGIYYAQNNEVQKLDSPTQLWEKLNKFIEEGMEEGKRK